MNVEERNIANGGRASQEAEPSENPGGCEKSVRLKERIRRKGQMRFYGSGFPVLPSFQKIRQKIMRNAAEWITRLSADSLVGARPHAAHPKPQSFTSPQSCADHTVRTIFHAICQRLTEPDEALNRFSTGKRRPKLRRQGQPPASVRINRSESPTTLGEKFQNKRRYSRGIVCSA